VPVRRDGLEGHTTRHLTLVRYLVATGIVTLVLLGVEGTVAWAASAVVAWLLSRHQPATLRSYTTPFVVWCVVVVLMLYGRHASP
jgi:hypothetical protein